MQSCGGFFVFSYAKYILIWEQNFISCDYFFDKTRQIFLCVLERLSKNLKYDLSVLSLPLQNISLSDQVSKCSKIFFEGHYGGI